MSYLFVEQDTLFLSAKNRCSTLLLFMEPQGNLVINLLNSEVLKSRVLTVAQTHNLRIWVTDSSVIISCRLSKWNIDYVVEKMSSQFSV